MAQINAPSPSSRISRRRTIISALRSKTKGKLPEAIARYRRAIALKPDFAEVHNNFGTLLTNQGKLDEAVVQYQNAIALKPDYAEAHLNLGTSFQGLGHLADADASYRRALEIDPRDNLGARIFCLRA